MLCCPAADLLHTTSQVVQVTQFVVEYIQEEMGLPITRLPTRRVVVPIQLDGCNACGYYAAFNFIWLVLHVLRSNSTSSLTYSEWLAVEMNVCVRNCDWGA